MTLKDSFTDEHPSVAVVIDQAPHLLFHVCNESRLFAFEKYSLDLVHNESGSLEYCNTRVEPLRDTVILRWSQTLSHTQGSSIISAITNAKEMALHKDYSPFPEIRHLALDESIWANSPLFSAYFNFIHNFGYLDEIVLFCNAERFGVWPHGPVLRPGPFIGFRPLLPIRFHKYGTKETRQGRGQGQGFLDWIIHQWEKIKAAEGFRDRKSFSRG